MELKFVYLVHTVLSAGVCISGDCGSIVYDIYRMFTVSAKKMRGQKKGGFSLFCQILKKII
jgi:hypothetical protein